MTDLHTSTSTGPLPEGVGARLHGQQVLVLGLGQSGLAMARWCARAGAQVTVVDTREQPPQREALARDWPEVRCVSAALDDSVLDLAPTRFDRMLCSPGLAPAQYGALLQAAQGQGLWVGGELDLFVQALAELEQHHAYKPALLAVTGTNGKTTVTQLTGQLVARSGKRVAVAGNIGPCLLDTLAEHLDAQTLPQVWVLELSSFQLHGVHQFEPTAGTVLNVTQDHLDWHGDMAAYVAAKARVWGEGALMLLNRDDPTVLAMGESARDAQMVVPGKGRAKPPPARPSLSFGASLPLSPGDFGIEEVNGMAWLVRALDDEDTGKVRRAAPVEPAQLHIQRLMPADALRIRGRHNAVNALAALALASAAGCALGPMLYGLREYRGEPHRVESIGVLLGVEYFDDSKGTNVGATAAALTGLGLERRVVVILGGVGKGQDFAPLAAPVGRYARAVVLMGRDAPGIEAALSGCQVRLEHAASMAQAVQLARQWAQAGDAVLLSPACASFDMFENYQHRAREFVREVQALAQADGCTLEVLA